MKKMTLMAIGMLFAMAGISQISVGVQATSNISDASINLESRVKFDKTLKALPGAGFVAQYDLPGKLSLCEAGSIIFSMALL